MTDNTELLGPRPMRAGGARLNRLLGLFAAPGILGYGAPIPPEERVLITDISAWNGNVNLTTMRNAGAEGTRMRATGCFLNSPACFTDNKYAANHLQADDIAYPYGPYHFLSNMMTGADQADYYLEATQGGRGQFPGGVDVELAVISATKIKAYAQYIYTEMQVYPDVYTSAYYWGKVTGTTDKTWITTHCGLWVAHWGTLTPLLPAGWTDYTMHQFSADNNGRGAEFGASGGDPDMDLNYCRRAWFEQYVPPQDWQHSIDAWARTMGYTGPGPG